MGGYNLPGDHHHGFVLEVFSTITSPAFSELVIEISETGVTYLPQDTMLFETLCKMYEVRPFQLVFFYPRVWDFLERRRELEEALDLVAAKGSLDFFDSPPTIRM